MSFFAHYDFYLQGVLDITYYFHFTDEETKDEITFVKAA